MLNKVFKAANLAAAPADEHVPARTKPGQAFWVYGYNHSPFVFEVLDDASKIIGIAQPFAPFKITLEARTEEIVLHASTAAMVPAAPLAAADLAFYIGITEYEPDLIPTPW